MDLGTARRPSIPAGGSLQAPSRMLRSARRLTEQSSTARTAPSQISALAAGRGRLPSASMEFGFATERRLRMKKISLAFLLLTAPRESIVRLVGALPCEL